VYVENRIMKEMQETIDCKTMKSPIIYTMYMLDCRIVFDLHGNIRRNSLWEKEEPTLIHIAKRLVLLDKDKIRFNNPYNNTSGKIEIMDMLDEDGEFKEVRAEAPQAEFVSLVTRDASALCQITFISGSVKMEIRFELCKKYSL